MATHSSVLAWRIPGTGEPAGLPSMESQSRTHLKRLSSSSSSNKVPSKSEILWLALDPVIESWELLISTACRKLGVSRIITWALAVRELLSVVFCVHKNRKRKKSDSTRFSKIVSTHSSHTHTHTHTHTITWFSSPSVSFFSICEQFMEFHLTSY